MSLKQLIVNYPDYFFLTNYTSSNKNNAKSNELKSLIPDAKQNKKQISLQPEEMQK